MFEIERNNSQTDYLLEVSISTVLPTCVAEVTVKHTYLYLHVLTLQMS